MFNPMRRISVFRSKEDKWIRSGFYFLCLTLFLMSFPRFLSLWTLGAFLFFGLICWITDFRSVKNKFFQNKFLIFPPVAYFSLYLGYFLLRDPMWEHVEDKLMFFLIPVLGFPVFISDYFKSNLRQLLLSFIYGILLIFIYQVSRATIESISFTEGTLKFEPFVSSEVSRYSWAQLSTLEHPPYLAIKTLWAIVMLLFIRNSLKLKVIPSAILAGLLSLLIFLLGVKAEMLIFVILLIYYFFYRLKTFPSKIAALIVIPLFLILFIITASHNQRVIQKINQLKEHRAAGKIDWKTFDPRTRSWFCSLTLIKEKPVFGVGLNARNILAEEYSRQGYKTEAELRLNAHNQFLETQLTFGIAGTLVLLWMLLTPVIKRKRLWNPELVFPFLIIVAVSMFFESILVRQWGIMFFVLFYCMLTIPKIKTDG